MGDPIFHLAIVDRDQKVLLVWPTPADAHRDLADQLAAAVHPGTGRREEKRRTQLAVQIRAHILELQTQTVNLVTPT